LDAIRLGWQRTRFEIIVERMMRRRQLGDDGNVDITARNLREKTPPIGQRSLFGVLTTWGQSRWLRLSSISQRSSPLT
jgi:hypothetical protein